MHRNGHFLEQRLWGFADRKLVQVIAHWICLRVDDFLELSPRKFLLDNDLGKEQHEQEDLHSFVGQEPEVFQFVAYAEIFSVAISRDETYLSVRDGEAKRLVENQGGPVMEIQLADNSHGQERTLLAAGQIVDDDRTWKLLEAEALGHLV